MLLYRVLVAYNNLTLMRKYFFIVRFATKTIPLGSSLCRHGVPGKTFPPSSFASVPEFDPRLILNN